MTLPNYAITGDLAALRAAKTARTEALQRELAKAIGQRQAYEDIFALVDELRDAGIRFPGGRLIPDTEPRRRDPFPIAIDITERNSLLLWGSPNCTYCACMLVSGIRTRHAILTTDWDRFKLWVLNEITRYEVTPSTETPIKPRTSDGAGRTRVIDLTGGGIANASSQQENQ